MIWPLSKMILALGVLGVGFFILVRWMKRNAAERTPASSDSGIRLLSTQPIAPEKFISLVDIGGEVLALGVSESQITFLAKIENKAFIETMESRGPVRSDVFSFLHSVRFPLKSKKPKAGFLRRVYGR